jgi:ActR/RegA family two-component response regulator
MDNPIVHKTALVACAYEPWQREYAHALIASGWEVDVTGRGIEAVQMVRKRPYSLLVIDDTIADLGALELVLNLRDLAGDKPQLLVAGQNLQRFQSIWTRCRAAFVGTHAELMHRLSHDGDSPRRLAHS